MSLPDNLPPVSVIGLGFMGGTEKIKASALAPMVTRWLTEVGPLIDRRLALGHPAHGLAS